jgi:hypothetical protein
MRHNNVTQRCLSWRPAREGCSLIGLAENVPGVVRVVDEMFETY